MKPFTTYAYINSLNGQMDEITVLEEKEESTGSIYYIVDYKGTKCTAIFNWFTCCYYADDVYGKI